MMMKKGEHWHCTNPACHCEILVRSDSELEGSSPLCGCGSPMKKKYIPPALAYLQFLRLEDPAAVRETSRKG